MSISMPKAFLYLKQNLEVRQAQIVFNFAAYLLILLFAIFIAGKDFCKALIENFFSIIFNVFKSFFNEYKKH
jgi:hypothetical protein